MYFGLQVDGPIKGGGGGVVLISGQLTVCCFFPQSTATLCFFYLLPIRSYPVEKCVIEVWKRSLPSLEVLSLSCDPLLVSASDYRLLFLV